MIKELLEQYPDICAELADLELAARTPVGDVVSASGSGYPYTKHPVRISGIPPADPALSARMEALRRQKREAERFVSGLPLSRKRRLARCVMKHGRRWNVIRREMGGDKSADAIRMEFERIFK